MLTPAAIDEAISVLGVMMTALSGTLLVSTGIAAANLKYAIEDLRSNADTLIRTGGVAQALGAAFDVSVQAGGTIPTFEAVRLALVGLAPVSVLAQSIAVIGIQLVLAQEIRVYVATTFTSRQDVQAAILQLNDAFSKAEEFAADNHDPASYTALIQAHSAIINHLSSTARPLPKMITYTVARIMTSHRLAQYLYSDSSRADELVAENKISHGAFMPLTGNALSA